MPRRDAIESAEAIYAAAVRYDEAVAAHEAAKAEFEILKKKISQDN
jgi:hypothetical protein